MPGFRPSWVLNFKLRFDEALTLQSVPPATSVEDRVKNPPTGAGSGAPLILRQGETSFIMERIPTQLSFEKPGFRQAGKFSATVPFRDLPIDPRTVRAAAVEIHLGAVSDENFAAGMKQGRLNAEFAGRQSVLQTRTADGGINGNTLRMLAIVDDWWVENDDKGSRVELSGRDLRGVLLDTPVNPGGTSSEQFLESLDLGQDVGTVVRQILAYNPFFSDFRVVLNPEDWPDGRVPNPGGPDVMPRHAKGARGKKKQGRHPPGMDTKQLNFWDIIVQVCYLVGAIPYFVGSEIVIRPAASLYDKLRGPVDPVRNPTPFAGGQLRSVDAIAHMPISPELRTRRLVYGRDTTSLKLGRKYGGWRRPKVVRCVSLDLSSGGLGLDKVIVGLWPPDADARAKRTRVAPSGQVVMEEAVTVRAPAGITDVGRCQEIARAVYEELGRGEMGGEVVTRNLASFGGDNSDPDLLRLEPGDGVEILHDTRAVNSGAPLVSTYTDWSRNSFEDQVEEITNRIGDEDLARVIVATARGQVAELQRFFRVQNVKFHCDAQSGVKISFDFQNYVVARAQVSNARTQQGEAVSAAVAGASGIPPARRGKSLRSL